jgi:hypothetical protein
MPLGLIKDGLKEVNLCRYKRLYKLNIALLVL